MSIWAVRHGRRKRSVRLVRGLVIASLVVGLSGCFSEYPMTPPRDGFRGSAPVPTGEALFAEAKENFIASRAELSVFLAEFDTGPWDVFHYGDSPVSCGSGKRNAGYYFEISRMVTHAGLDMEEYSQRAVEMLSAAGFATKVSRFSEKHINVTSERETGPLHDVYVGISANGSLLMKGNSVCFPGDSVDLAKLMTQNFKVRPPAIDFDAPSDPPVFGLPE